MNKRRIIVNADDLGLSPSVNSAILEVFRAGNLSSATLMVDMPGTHDAVERLREHPGLAVGLHFCISEGRAITGASTLTDAQGAFLDRSTLARRAFKGQLDGAHIHDEFKAQLERLRSFGITPTHSDSHQHVMMLPAVFDAVMPVLEHERLPARMVDPPRGSVTASLGRPKKAMKQWLNQRFATRNRARFSGRTNDSLVSIHDLDDGGPYDSGTYRALLARAPQGDVVEVMVHPYILGEDVLALYRDRSQEKMPFFQRCEAEYQALRGAPVFGGEELTNFGLL